MMIKLAALFLFLNSGLVLAEDGPANSFLGYDGDLWGVASAQETYQGVVVKIQGEAAALLYASMSSKSVQGSNLQERVKGQKGMTCTQTKHTTTRPEKAYTWECQFYFHDENGIQ